MPEALSKVVKIEVVLMIGKINLHPVSAGGYWTAIRGGRVRITLGCWRNSSVTRNKWFLLPSRAVIRVRILLFFCPTSVPPNIVSINREHW